jgi:hypothetical protein
VEPILIFDFFRGRMYLASAGLCLTLNSGKFESREINSETGSVPLEPAAATQFTLDEELRSEQPAAQETPSRGNAFAVDPGARCRSLRAGHKLLRNGFTIAESSENWYP